MRWYVGLIFSGKEGVEKTMELTIANETDVADIYRAIWFPWIWLPKSMSVRRIFDGKLFAKDIVISHRWPQGQGNPSIPVGGVASG